METEFYYYIGAFILIMLSLMVYAMLRAPVIDENTNDIKSEKSKNLHPTKNKNVTRGADGRFQKIKL